MKLLIVSISLIVLLVSSDAIAISSQPELERDPFSNAKVKKLLERSKKPVVKKPRDIRWRPKLFATIVSGEQSMVNLDGKILRIGDTVDRYRLIAVNRYSATFKRGARYRKIKLYNPVDGQ